MQHHIIYITIISIFTIEYILLLPLLILSYQDGYGINLKFDHLFLMIFSLLLFLILLCYIMKKNIILFICSILISCALLGYSIYVVYELCNCLIHNICSQHINPYIFCHIIINIIIMIVCMIILNILIIRKHFMNQKIHPVVYQANQNI